MNVLIVSDDEEDIEVLFEVIAETLSDAICAFADTASRCFKVITDLPAPDVIFLDGRLPDMPSETCLEKLAIDPKLAGTKIILYSGLGGPELERRFLARGAHHFIEKPGSMTQLRHALSQIFHVSVAT